MSSICLLLTSSCYFLFIAAELTACLLVGRIHPGHRHQTLASITNPSFQTLRSPMNRVFNVSPAASALSPGAGCRPYRSEKRLFCRGLRTLIVLSVFVTALFSSNFLRAQTFYGSISGVVKDPSGAVVPKVAVTVHENSTATEYKTVTDKGGSYRISFLKPGGLYRSLREGRLCPICYRRAQPCPQSGSDRRPGPSSSELTPRSSPSPQPQVRSTTPTRRSAANSVLRNSSTFPKAPAPKAQNEFLLTKNLRRSLQQ